MNDLVSPLIILIGGAAGTSKTTFGKKICNEFDIDHRLGTGFIREIAKSYISREENPFLYNYSFQPHINISPFENLYKQSAVINNSMELCINRSYNEGTSLLIEGVNVIPGLIDTTHCSFMIVLSVEDYDQHYSMINGKTHFKRKISRKKFTNVRLIQERLMEAAINNHWSINKVNSIDNVINKIKNHIEQQ